MIQLNLLPDVKLEFVKAQRTKHAVISGAVIATAATFLIFIFMFVGVHVVQAKIISSQTSDIKKYTKQLQDTPDLDRVLTVQGQLNSLTGLHAAKPAASRSFAFIQQLTPKDVSLTEVSIDYETNTLSVSGKAPKLDNVNTMVDTIKFTTYGKTSEQSTAKAFSDVVLSQFTRSTDTTTFTVSATYDPVIFDNEDTVSLKVPAGISTPSVASQPTFTKIVTPSSTPTNESGN